MRTCLTWDLGIDERSLPVLPKQPYILNVWWRIALMIDIDGADVDRLSFPSLPMLPRVSWLFGCL